MIEKVYDRLMDHLEIKGYLTEADVVFIETNVSDLAYCILASVVSDFRRTTVFSLIHFIILEPVISSLIHLLS